jgi:SH3-like domain-containing protein
VESAQVTWEVALIRDAPRTGKILARLQRGTSLRVGAAKDGWYPVKYGDGFASDGWVFRGAIGR